MANALRVVGIIFIIVGGLIMLSAFPFIEENVLNLPGGAEIEVETGEVSETNLARLILGVVFVVAGIVMAAIKRN